MLRRQAFTLAIRARGALASSSAPTAQPWGVLAARAFADDANLKKTALYDLHVKHGGEAPSCQHKSTSPHQVPGISQIVIPL